MNHYILHIHVGTALKQPWFRWKIILWWQLIKVSQYYWFFCTCLRHWIRLIIIYLSLGWKTCSICQVKYVNRFKANWNNTPRECLFMVFCRMFSFCYLGYNRVQVLELCFSQCITVLLVSLRIDMALNSSCIMITDSCIYITGSW